jgi:hypothetical protein
MAAIFVYIGVNLEPGFLRSPFKWRHLKQTLNIGGSLRWSRRGIALYWEGRNDYQEASLRDDGIVSSAMNNEIAVKNNVNTTVATITTPTYSSGVAGLNGVKRKDSPTRQRCLVQTANIGGNLKWQSRHIALVIRKVLETTKRYLFGDNGIVRSHGKVNHELTLRNHDCFCSHRIIVALESNLHRITLQIRGNLNLVKGMVIAELSRKLNTFGQCGETRRSASFGMVV